MKKLRMVVTSLIILAIVGGAFAFNAKKQGKFCYTDTFNGTCQVSDNNLKRVAVGTEDSFKRYYVVNWDGEGCASETCTIPSGFIGD